MDNITLAIVKLHIPPKSLARKNNNVLLGKTCFSNYFYIIGKLEAFFLYTYV